MKRNTLRWLGVTVAAAVSVWCWYLLKMEPESAARAAGKGVTAAAQVTGNGSAPKLVEPWPKFGTPEFKSALKERGLKWLDSRGRDAAGLVAMWDLTRDAELLTEAAEKFPDDPRVCMAMIKCTAPPARSGWVLSQITAEPANPEGHYLKISSLAEDDHAGALAALRQAAVLKGPRNDHMAERIQTAREAAIACGVNTGDAARLALTILWLRNLTEGTLHGVLGTLYGELEEAKTSGSEQRLMEIRALGLATAEKFSDDQCLSIRDAMDKQQLKSLMMEGLPDDALIGAGGPSVGVLRVEVNAQRKNLATHHHMEGEADAALQTASDAERVDYLNNYLAHGEAEAQKWLLEQAGKAK